MRGATWFESNVIAPIKEFQSTLLMRGATEVEAIRQLEAQFQSTLLMRGATEAPASCSPTHDISIHAPHARSDVSWPIHRGNLQISIHAPHARSDADFNQSFQVELLFQSTLLMRGATRFPVYLRWAHRISIHAPHARSDVTRLRLFSKSQYFNPRSSCEERP